MRSSTNSLGTVQKSTPGCSGKAANHPRWAGSREVTPAAARHNEGD